MNKAAVAQKPDTTSFLSPTQGVLQRKCACGNQTAGGGKCAGCGKKKRSLQRKLTIGASNDPLEREADRVADQVMAMPTNSNIAKVPPRIQRFTGQSADSGQVTAPASVDRVLAGSGRPLEPVFRQDMEQRFDRDFSQVRVHSGTAVEQSAREVNADAYTAGNNIVFGAGQFAPRIHEGRRLIAHELTHVVQQAGGTDRTVLRNVRSNSVCVPNTDNAPGNPIDQLRLIDAEAQRMALSAAIFLDFVSIDSGIFPVVTTAYRRFFGDPPAVAGGFRSRFDGQVHATSDEALSEEMNDASENFRQIHAALTRDIRYRCTGTRQTYLEECTHQCGGNDIAAACAGRRMSSIAICPLFWDPATPQMRASYLIHEAVHARLGTAGHPNPFRGRRGGPGCYENFIAEVNGIGATDATCPAKF